MNKVLLYALATLSILGAFTLTYAGDSTLTKIVQTKELKVGMELGCIPFEMKDKHGNIIGFDIDLVKDMAKAINVKPIFIPTDWDGIIPSLITGKFDMIVSCMAITPERNTQVNYTDAYLDSGISFVKQLKHKETTIKDLDKSTTIIGAKLGETSELVARKLFKKAKIMTYDSVDAMNMDALTNKIDGFMYDKPGNDIFMLTKGKDKLSYDGKAISYEPIAIAIRKGDPDFMNFLNNYLKIFIKDGTQEKLYDYWFKNSDWHKKVF
ncbi:MAG: transporter substrate-binding domain-containing protein [Candidatus Gracilibacteria bacterium]|nr:transporter substrate-binding domain-containing protein [Candidatus Gracilibacteria bacterium]